MHVQAKLVFEALLKPVTFPSKQHQTNSNRDFITFFRQKATHMATCMTLLVIHMALISAATPADIASKSQDLVVAIEEMARANYFTFVMLLNMSPFDRRIQENVTFLMPNDRMLSTIRMPQNAVFDFLLRHSIPSPLRFDHLQHIPSGSVIPSSEPEYMLSIYNKGRKSFFLNNVKIISPNLCTAGSSIRCHGIDGVLLATPKPPLPTCSNSTSPIVVLSPPAPSLSSPGPAVDDPNQNHVAAPPPDQNVGLKKSESSHSQCVSRGGLFTFLVISIVMSIMGFFI